MGYINAPLGKMWHNCDHPVMEHNEGYGSCTHDGCDCDGMSYNPPTALDVENTSATDG